jgi:hypothetical protein
MISIRLLFSLTTAALALGVHGDRCAAAVAFDSFGPNDTYGSTGANWQGNHPTAEVKLAQRFTPQVSGQLSKLELGLTSFDSQNGLSGDVITFAIVSDIDGKPGTTELWSQTYIGNVPPRTQIQGATSFSVSGGPLLQEGIEYWLTSTTPPTSGTHTWWLSPFPHEPYAFYFIRSFNQVEGEWNVRESPTWFGAPVYSHALRVTVIPEPAAAALMLAASATFIAMRRRALSL